MILLGCSHYFRLHCFFFISPKTQKVKQKKSKSQCSRWKLEAAAPCDLEQEWANFLTDGPQRDCSKSRWMLFILIYPSHWINNYNSYEIKIKCSFFFTVLLFIEVTRNTLKNRLFCGGYIKQLDLCLNQTQ